MFLSLTQNFPWLWQECVCAAVTADALDSGFDSVFAWFPGILGNGVPAVLVHYGWIQAVRLLWEWEKCCMDLFLVCTSPWKVLDTDLGNEVFLKFYLFAWTTDICIKNQKIELHLVWIWVKSSCWWHQMFASCPYMWKIWNLLLVIQK